MLMFQFTEAYIHICAKCPKAFPLFRKFAFTVKFVAYCQIVKNRLGCRNRTVERRITAV